MHFTLYYILLSNKSYCERQMNRYWHYDCFPSNSATIPHKFFSYKSCPKNNSDPRNISVSGNGKINNKMKQSNIGQNRHSHTRNNSQLKKNKSKCQTQINLSSKKKRDPINLSKETIRKKNSSQLSQKKYKNQKSSMIKIQQSKTVKHKSKKIRSSNEIFHSTSYSRHFEQDLELQDDPILINSEVIYANEKVQSKERKPMRTWQQIFEKTHRTLSFYKSKCETLQSSCAYYKNELNKVVKKLERMKKCSKSKYKEYKKQTPTKKQIGVN